MSITGVTPHSRMDELDGVRGFAALAVVYAHLFLMWIPAPNAAIFWLRTGTGMAWTGVVLFFALSGFLIGGNLLRYRDAPNYFSVFYTRRAFRIFPLYYFLLAVFFLLQLIPALKQTDLFANGHVPLWTYPLLVQNFPMAITGDWGAHAIGVTWSVALEEQFYLFVPLLVRYASPRWLPYIIAALAASGPLFRHFLPVAHAPFLLPGSTESLFGGVFLAWLHHTRPALFKSSRILWLSALTLLLSGAGMALIAARRDFAPFDGTIIAAFWTSFLWLVIAGLGTKWTAPFRMKWLREIGRISYGIYLFHTLIYLLVFHALAGGGPTHAMGLKGLALAALSFVLTLVFAATSFHLFEQRLIRFGQKFKYAPPARADLP